MFYAPYCQASAYAFTKDITKPGQNSFTASQIKNCLMQNGFTDIKRLRLDDKGIWRALVEFKKYNFLVSVDYSGTMSIQNKRKNMIHFKTHSNIDSKSSQRTFFKKIYYSLKEPSFIGILNGSVSGALAAILAAYGYIALPGFGPIIAMGIDVAFCTGTIIGAMIGLIMGIFVGLFCTFMEDLYT